MLIYFWQEAARRGRHNHDPPVEVRTAGDGRRRSRSYCGYELAGRL